MEANDKVINRLRKLIRHEQSARTIGSVAEAEVFAAKIQQFLLDAGLKMSDVEISERQTSMGNETVGISLRFTWAKVLLAGIAYANGCQIIYENQGKGASLLGEDEDRGIVNELFTYFADLGQAMAHEQAFERRDTYEGSPGDFKRSFIVGFADALVRRIRLAHDEAIRNAQANAPEQSTALIYIGNKLQRTNAYAAQLYGRLGFKKKSSATIRSGAGYNSRHAAGNSVALTSKTFGR